MKSIVIAAVLAFVVPFGSFGAEPATPSGSADQERSSALFTSHFLRAFENLDLDRVMACFAPDATVFRPLPEPPELLDGRTAIREHFSKQFSAIRRASKATSPPYLRLPAQHLAVKILSSNSAVVTFELVNQERIARRTLVLIGTPNGWLIQHLHASNVPVQR